MNATAFPRFFGTLPRVPAESRDPWANRSWLVPGSQTVGLRFERSDRRHGVWVERWVAMWPGDVARAVRNTIRYKGVSAEYPFTSTGNPLLGSRFAGVTRCSHMLENMAALKQSRKRTCSCNKNLPVCLSYRKSLTSLINTQHGVVCPFSQIWSTLGWRVLEGQVSLEDRLDPLPEQALIAGPLSKWI